MNTEERERPYLYELITDKITQLIEAGTLVPGDKVPSLRRLSGQEGVSVSTVMQAYYELESRGLIEARPQSGFYVRLEPRSFPREPETSRPPSRACCVGMADLVEEVFSVPRDLEMVVLGAAIPSPQFFPNRKLNRLLSSIARRDPAAANSYDLVPGNSELRREIARRSIDWGGALSRRDIVITAGCTEALNLCLRAVTGPGDIVAVESPTYYALLGILELLDLKALEIPTSPRSGISLEALERAIAVNEVRACVVMPNAHNPLGSCMPDDKKKSLVEMATAKEIPVIEDDVYGDLCFTAERPKPLKAFDREGWVLHCSSFTKTLAPGHRIGWTAPGRFTALVSRRKQMSTGGNTVLSQMMIAEFLKHGGYDLHLRKIRRAYLAQIQRITQAISRYFPENTRVTRPQGGHVVWVELPAQVDALELNRKALEEKISIIPGPVFSPTRRYQHFIRLNAAFVWSDRIERSLMILGRLATELIKVHPARTH